MKALSLKIKLILKKNISHEFKSIDIFKASDTMIDFLTQLIAKKRDKNIN